MSRRQLDIRQIRCPYLIRIADYLAGKKVRILLVFLACLRKVPPGKYRLQTGPFHYAPNLLFACLHMFCTYFSCNFPVAIKWKPRKNGSYVLKNDQIALLHRAFPFVIGNASAYSEQITLPGDMQLGMNPFNQKGSVPYSWEQRSCYVLLFLGTRSRSSWHRGFSVPRHTDSRPAVRLRFSCLAFQRSRAGSLSPAFSRG